VTEHDADGEITVMVVDDHPIWREGVARDLQERGVRVVATAPDAAAAVRIAYATRPRVVLMDLNLGAGSGVTAIAEIMERLPATRILVLSASGEHTDVLEAVKAGATGYLVKSAGPEELLAAVRRTADGYPVFTPGLAGLVLGEYRRLADEPPGPAGADRAGDRCAAAGGQGVDREADRRAAAAVPPHRGEPRAEHPAQAAAAQPRPAGALRDRAGPGGRLNSLPGSTT
jgi:DNA-binding NarL/FixJ family response regulator